MRARKQRLPAADPAAAVGFGGVQNSSKVFDSFGVQFDDTVKARHDLAHFGRLGLTRRSYDLQRVASPLGLFRFLFHKCPYLDICPAKVDFDLKATVVWKTNHPVRNDRGT